MLEIVFVVLMMFWLFGGLYTSWDGPTGRPGMAVISGTLIPFLCVLILGAVVFGWIGVRPIR